MQLIAGLLSGLLFGLGLIIAGMTNPQKIQNFLDLAGHWDPSLAFVMIGAIAVALPSFRWLGSRARPWFAEQFHWPSARQLDKPLIAGAALFGIGWGISGLCPGPVFTVLSSVLLPNGSYQIVPFFLAMMVGMMLANIFKHWMDSTGRSNPPAVNESVS